MKIKDKKIITCLIAVLVLIIIVASLVIHNKQKRGDWINLDKDNTKIENSSDYLSTITYLNLNTLPDDYYGYFYKDDKVIVKNMNNKIKLYMAIRKVITDKQIDITKEEIKVKASDVEKALKLLFGNNVEYKHESLTGNTCSYTNFKYSNSDKIYIQKSDKCIEPRTGSIINEIINITEEKDKLIVTEKMAYIETSYNFDSKQVLYNIYKDINKTEKVTTVNSYSITSCKNLLNSYKYTFKKDKNNYYLESVELVK